MCRCRRVNSAFETVFGTGNESPPIPTSPSQPMPSSGRVQQELSMRYSVQHASEIPNDTEATVTDVTSVNKPTASLRELLATLKRPADNKCFRALGPDGILRRCTYLPGPPDQPTGIAVYDAIPLSPYYVKKYLDTKPWSLKVEDSFRGVDGRTVPHEQWMNPPPGTLPQLGSYNERVELRQVENTRIRTQEREDEMRTSRGEEVDVRACGSVRSDYDLHPHQG